MIVQKKHTSLQDEVQLTAPCAPPKAINLDECILCQKKKRSEYLSSGETGRSCIVSLAKQIESYDIQAARILQLTVPEQGIIKYHASSCYRSFQRDMKKTVSILTQPEQSEPPEQAQEPENDLTEQRCKRFKPTD